MQIHFRTILSFALLSTIIFLAACKKETVQPPSKTKTDLLTANVWIYQEVYWNWQLSNQQLVYRRNPPINTINLSGTRVKFYRDGTFEEFTTSGTYITGTWQFTNNETQVMITNGSNTNTVSIVTLTEDNHDWHDLTSKAYGKMTAKK